MTDVINAVLDAAEYDHPLASMDGITKTGGELNARSAIIRFMSGWSPFQCSQLTYEGNGAQSETWCNLYTDHRTEMLPLGPDGWHGYLPNCGTATKIAGCDASEPEVTVYDPYMFEIGGFFWQPGVIYTISGCHPAGLDLVTQMTNCGFDFVCAGPPPDGCDSGFSYQMMGCQDVMNSYRSKTLMVGSATRPEPELVRELRVTIEASYPGDLNDDDRVDGGDLALLLSDWGDCSGCPTDFDRDGIVGGSDMAVILGYWGEAASSQTCASATPIELDTPTTFAFGPLDEDLAVGGCRGIDGGLRSVNWYSFTATSSEDVKIDYQHNGPAEGLQMGFVVMESCDVGSRIACSTGDMYTPSGSCFHFWAEAGKTYKIAAGTSAYATPWPQGHASHAPTSGSGVITLSPN